MMKRRSESAISRVRLDGRSKDERYRADNLRARSPLVAASEEIFLLLLLPTVRLHCTFNAKYVHIDRTLRMNVAN